MTTTYTLKAPLNSGCDSLLRKLEQHIKKFDIPFYIAGSTARDLVLHHIYKQPRTRKIVDIDTIVMVADWAGFKRVKEGLLNQDMRPTGYAHRIIDNATGLPVDIIPFCNPDSDSKEVYWPPAHVVDMSVLGFNTLYQRALNVDIGSDCKIKIVSIAGLALLKLVAWRDRRLLTVKDAADFLILLEQYQFVQQHRLTDEAVPSAELAFQTQRIGAYLLGFDVCSLTIQTTWPCLEEIRFELKDQFLFALTRTHSTLLTTEIEQLLGDFWSGVGEDVVLVG